ncbi:NAD(P)H-binding protein [Sorangium sp. So ce1000]|uniref:NAD(P)H-binding protein n=1 Tax=Sorangium sp. So ce1000 TaxID=3133325 RepID=UPI003F5D9D90
MRTVAIIGASGVVGSRVLEHLLAREDVGRVIALGRRVVSVQHPKLESRVVDLQRAAAMIAELPDGVDVAISAIGTTLKNAGSQAAFRAVDHDAVLAFANAARSKGAQRFLFVSSVRADAGSGSFYLRTKGEVEDGLAQLGFPQLIVLRPSLIDDQGARPEHRFGERLALSISRALFSLVGNKTHRFAPIPADVIARALVRLAFDSSHERSRIIESDRLHELGA